MSLIDINMLRYKAMQDSVLVNSDCSQDDLQEVSEKLEGAESKKFHNWQEFNLALENCEDLSGATVEDIGGTYVITSVSYELDENKEFKKNYTSKKL